MSPVDTLEDRATFEGGVAAGSRLPTFRHIGPNWYAVVMGTAIVPGAGVGLPHQFPGAIHVWQVTAALAFLELVVLVAARAVHWLFHPDQARAHLLDATAAPYYACASMAFLAVGLVSYTVGHTMLPDDVAVLISAVLWTIGTIIGLVSSLAVMMLMITKHSLQAVSQSPAWLLPPMGLMVSAAFAGPLLQHMAPGQGKSLLLLCLYAMFGLDLIATLIVFPMVLQRLYLHGPMPVQLTPLLFLGIAPFGQGVNALCNLADAATTSGLPHPLDQALAALSLVGGVPIMGFTLLWAAACLGMLAWGFTKGLTFSMAWWATPFAWGTIVTGMTGITRYSGVEALSWVTVAAYVVLCALVLYAWPRTMWRLVTGRLPAAPPLPAAPAAAAAAA